MTRAAILAAVGLMAIASNAAALIITGGPQYTLVAGGSCSISGETSRGTGATVSCTGINLSAHTKVYFGIRNDINVNGNTMTGAAPAAASAAVFRFTTTTANSITYTSSTSVASALVGHGTPTVTNTLVLTRTAGTASVVPAGGNPGNNGNGDVGALFQITSGSTLTLDVDVLASDAFFGLGQACPAVYDAEHATFGNNGDVSKVDVAFYVSDCGDGQVDTPEQCDDGMANGTLASCCTTSCTYKSNGTACTDDGNVCTNDQCNATGSCTHPNNTAPCSDGLFCNGADTCSGGSCVVHAGDPCLPLNTGDGNCSTSCDEGADNCTAPDPNGTGCSDGLFCNGADSCNGGTCSAHVGDPCLPLNTSDGNCSASCDEAVDTCTAPDPNGTGCSDGLFCNGADMCSGGSCVVHAGDPCTGPDGDTNCSESCDESADNCLAADPDGTLCRPAAGDCDVAETCSGGTCPANGFQMSGTACGSPSDTDCDNPDTCDGSGTCLANNEGSGFPCGDPSDTDCSDPDTCNGSGTCLVNDEPSGTPCTDDGETCTVDECDGGGTCTHPAGNAGVQCRAASPGQLCDEAELCDGTSPTCPADGVKPAGTVCRPDAGECDVEEQCDGSSSACPPDVASPAGTPCGSPSDTDCSNPDTCDGLGACDPNNEPISVQCRAASVGLACDAPEFCDGAGNCPADAAQPNGTPCRPAAGVCDLAENCDGISFNCPADAKSTGVCRPAVDPICDVAENCDGSSNNCPADVVTPDGTSCSDGLFCNGDETCASGACSAGMNPCEVACDEGTDTCQTCASAPLSMCRTALKSLLLLKNGSPDTKDRLVWKWIKGAATSTMDLADPTSTASYSLCIYDNTSNLVAQMGVPADSTKWQPISDKGFKYTDLNHTADGAFKIKLKSGAANKAKALVKGRDMQLPDPLTTALTLPVRVQLVNNGTGICFQSDFMTAKTNTTSKFKAKAP